MTRPSPRFRRLVPQSGDVRPYGTSLPGVMFSTPIPRSSILDSPMRHCSRERRRLAHATRPSPSPLGHGTRAPRAARMAQTGRRTAPTT